MSFGGPGMTQAVTSSGGWQRSEAGLGALSLLGKRDAPTSFAHPTPSLGDMSCRSADFLSPFISSSTSQKPRQRPGPGRKAGGRGRRGRGQTSPHPTALPTTQPALCLTGPARISSRPWAQNLGAGTPNSISVWLARESLSLFIYTTGCGRGGLD